MWSSICEICVKRRKVEKKKIDLHVVAYASSPMMFVSLYFLDLYRICSSFFAESFLEPSLVSFKPKRRIFQIECYLCENCGSYYSAFIGLRYNKHLEEVNVMKY